MSDTPDNRVRLTTRSERSSTFIELGSWIITHKRYIKSACLFQKTDCCFNNFLLLLSSSSSLPYNRILTVSVSDFDDNSENKFFTLSRRAFLCMRWRGQRMRKCSVVSASSMPQEHKGILVSVKLCRYLCSRKRERPNLSLDRSFSPVGLRILNIEFSCGRIKLNKIFLNCEIEFICRISEFNLFHSLTQYGKNEFAK